MNPDECEECAKEKTHLVYHEGTWCCMGCHREIHKKARRVFRLKRRNRLRFGVGTKQGKSNITGGNHVKGY